MTNVIRPAFGGPAGDQTEIAQPDTFSEFIPLRVYGTGVGHLVTLIRTWNGLMG